MMMRLSNALRLSLVLSAAPLVALAQTAPLPETPVKSAQRSPISVPATPDLSLPPLPETPAQPGIPTAPVTDLGQSRFPGPVTGPEPSRLPAERSTLVYADGAEVLPAGTDAVLADIVARLKARPAERLELRAFATAQDDRPNEGRRTALLRVRALRDRLVQLGIDPLRLLVFAEGMSRGAAGASPPDRIDLVIRT